MEKLKDILYVKWQQAAELNDFVKGDEYYQTLRQMNHAPAGISFTMGLWYRQQQQYEQALAAFSHSLLVDLSQNGEILYEMANTYSEMGQDQQASILYARAIDIQPDLLDAYFEYGRLLGRMGQIILARQQFCQVVALAPQAENYIAVGVELSALGLGEEAIEMLNRSLAVAPRNYLLYSNLGVEYVQIGEFTDGLFCHEKALSLNSFNGDLWYNMACGCALAGWIDKSLSALDKAVHLDNNNKYFAANDSELEILHQMPQFWQIIRC